MGRRTARKLLMADSKNCMIEAVQELKIATHILRRNWKNAHSAYERNR